MRKLNLFGMMMFVFMAIIATSCTTQFQNAGAVSYKESFLVDVRTPGEFQSGTVQGAVNIPLDEVGDRLEEFRGKKQVVVFCQSGGRSGQAMQILKQNNVANVVNGGSWTEVDAVLKAEETGK